MARTAADLVATVILAVSAVLAVPAMIEATGAVSYSTGEYSGYLRPILEYAPLLLALIAFVVLAAFIFDT